MKHFKTSKKILSLKEFSFLVSKAPYKSKRFVFTNGCFDILHVGHSRYLEAARSLGDYLVVGLNTDKSVRALKGPKRPIVPQNERAELLAALACVDFVILFGAKTPLSLIKAIRPFFLVKGGDWNEDQIVGSSFVRSYGGKVKSLPFVDGKSTTNIIQKIKKSK